jgi:GTPase
LLISSVTGENFDLFISLLSKLPATHTQESHTDKEHAEFHVEEVFSVPSAGTVIGGTLLNGMIKSDPNALYHLGPNQNGEFVSVKIKSIYRHRIATQMVRPGQSATLAIVHKANPDGEIDQPLDSDLSIRSGMVLLGCLTPPSVYYEFEADVTVLYHANVLKALFETMVHCGSICQSAKIVNIKKCKDGDNFASSSESQRIAGKMGLRTGERGLVKFRFCRRPEFLKLGSPLVIREGNNKLIGKITKVG